MKNTNDSLVMNVPQANLQPDAMHKSRQSNDSLEK